MKIKTFLGSQDEVDKLVNDFETTHVVKATQTDMILLLDGSILHKAVVFYEGERK